MLHYNHFSAIIVTVGKKNSRHYTIISLLQERNGIAVKELSEILDVSEMTVRRDLHELEQRQEVRLFHGGVILDPVHGKPAGIIDKTNPRYQLTAEDVKNTERKKRIGKKAAELVEVDDIIIIDSGSTTIHLAEEIPEDHPFTAIFWALNILDALKEKENCSMIFAGGYYHENSMMFESPEGVALIGRNRANKGFFAAGGVSDRLGVTNSNPYAVEIKQASLASSLVKILLVDSSKFGDIKPAHYAELTGFDTVITDDGVPEEYIELIEKLGITLLVV